MPEPLQPPLVSVEAEKLSTRASQQELAELVAHLPDV
jgi:hypothetical protein